MKRSSDLSRGGMAAGLWVLMAGAAFLGAQEASDEALRELAKKAVALEIQLQVVSSGPQSDSRESSEGDEVLWNRQTRKLTIPGRGVAVRMEGETLRLLAKITPYNQNNGKVLLVIQGQVWAQEPDSRRVQYHSTMKSLSLGYDETAYFFPLGTASLRRRGQDASGDGEAGLRMSLKVVPYESADHGSADDGSAENGTGS